MAFRSGSAADTQAITDVVKYKLNFAEIEQGRPALVKDAAMAFKDICYEYRDSLMAGLIVAGYDQVNGGQVWCIPIGGMYVRQPMCIGGSGSIFLYGMMDRLYKVGTLIFLVRIIIITLSSFFRRICHRKSVKTWFCKLYLKVFIEMEAVEAVAEWLSSQRTVSRESCG